MPSRAEDEADFERLTSELKGREQSRGEGKTLNNNWVNEQRAVGEIEEEGAPAKPAKPKSLCGCWTTQVLDSR